MFMFFLKGQKGPKGITGDPGKGPPGPDGPQGPRGEIIFLIFKDTKHFLYKLVQVIHGFWDFRFILWLFNVFFPLCKQTNTTFNYRYSLHFDVVNIKCLFVFNGRSNFLHFCDLSQVSQATQQNLKMGLRVLVGLGVSLVWWVHLVRSETRVCQGSARPGTAAFMHQ